MVKQCIEHTQLYMPIHFFDHYFDIYLMILNPKWLTINKICKIQQVVQNNPLFRMFSTLDTILLAAVMLYITPLNAVYQPA